VGMSSRSSEGSIVGSIFLLNPRMSRSSSLSGIRSKLGWIQLSLDLL
jgi:hypothetical protein